MIDWLIDHLLTYSSCVFAGMEFRTRCHSHAVNKVAEVVFRRRRRWSNGFGTRSYSASNQKPKRNFGLQLDVGTSNSPEIARHDGTVVTTCFSLRLFFTERLDNSLQNKKEQLVWLFWVQMSGGRWRRLWDFWHHSERQPWPVVLALLPLCTLKCLSLTYSELISKLQWKTAQWVISLFLFVTWRFPQIKNGDNYGIFNAAVFSSHWSCLILNDCLMIKKLVN